MWHWRSLWYVFLSFLTILTFECWRSALSSLMTLLPQGSLSICHIDSLQAATSNCLCFTWMKYRTHGRATRWIWWIAYNALLSVILQRCEMRPEKHCSVCPIRHSENSLTAYPCSRRGRQERVVHCAKCIYDNLSHRRRIYIWGSHEEVWHEYDHKLVQQHQTLRQTGQPSRPKATLLHPHYWHVEIGVMSTSRW